MMLTHYVLAAFACLLVSTSVHGLPNRRAEDDSLPYEYPTTLTDIQSTTKSFTTDGGAAQVFHKLVMITVETATLLEPWPAEPTSFPHTLVQTKILDRTIESTMAEAVGGKTVSTKSTTQITVPSTWVLFEPEPTYAPASVGFPCEECAPNDWEGDPRCEENGLDTACQGQCISRYGLYWCYQRYISDEGAKVMGRACWGKGVEYMQLVEPCLSTDHEIACTPCQGKDRTWDDITWLFD